MPWKRAKELLETARKSWQSEDGRQEMEQALLINRKATPCIIITEEQIGAYKLTYEDVLKDTADSDMRWEDRKESADFAAATLQPKVPQASGLVAAARHHKDMVPPVEEKTKERIDDLLAWKSRMTKKYRPKKETKEMTLTDTATAEPEDNGDRPDFKRERGFIMRIVEEYFTEHNVQMSPDSELAFFLSCHPTALYNARKALEEKGYKFEKRKNGIYVVERPQDQEKEAEMARIRYEMTELGEKYHNLKSRLEALESS